MFRTRADCGRGEKYGYCCFAYASVRSNNINFVWNWCENGFNICVMHDLHITLLYLFVEYTFLHLQSYRLPCRLLLFCLLITERFKDNPILIFPFMFVARVHIAGDKTIPIFLTVKSMSFIWCVAFNTEN